MSGRDWQETGHIECKEGFCKIEPCGNKNYLTACGELFRCKDGMRLKFCPKCGKPVKEGE